MTRREIYRRTKGHAIFGVVFSLFSAVLIVATAVLAAREGPGGVEEALPLLAAAWGGLVLLPDLLYWRYWLDLLQRDLVVFQGQVRSGGQVAGSRMETGWRNWRLVEQGGDAAVLGLPAAAGAAGAAPRPPPGPVPRAPVSFRYLRRSGCVVELLAYTPPEPDTRSPHARKKARRRAQHRP